MANIQLKFQTKFSPQTCSGRIMFDFLKSFADISMEDLTRIPVSLLRCQYGPAKKVTLYSSSLKPTNLPISPTVLFCGMHHFGNTYKQALKSFTPAC